MTTKTDKQAANWFTEVTFEVPLSEEVPVAEVRSIARERVVIQARSVHDQVVVDEVLRQEQVEVEEDGGRGLDPGE